MYFHDSHPKYVVLEWGRLSDAVEPPAIGVSTLRTLSPQNYRCRPVVTSMKLGRESLVLVVVPAIFLGAMYVLLFCGRGPQDPGSADHFDPRAVPAALGEQLAAWPEQHFGPPRILLPDGSARFKVQSIDDWVEAEERKAATS